MVFRRTRHSRCRGGDFVNPQIICRVIPVCDAGARRGHPGGNGDDDVGRVTRGERKGSIRHGEPAPAPAVVAPDEPAGGGLAFAVGGLMTERVEVLIDGHFGAYLTW